MSQTLTAFTEIESIPQSITNPPPAQKKAVRSGDAFELENYFRGVRNETAESLPSGAQTPQNRDGITSSRSPTSQLRDALPPVQAWNYPAGNRWRVLSSCLAFLGMGIHDSAAGALIPYIETHFHIGYAVVSLIFVTTAIGFLSAAFVNDVLQSKLGRQRTLMLAESLMIVGYILIVSPTPFPVVVAAFFPIGFAMSVILAVCNVFGVNLAKSSIVLGSIHGAYGLGGIIGPIIATALVSHGVLWSRFYIVTLGIRVLSLIFAGLAWHKYEDDTQPTLLTALERTASRMAANEESVTEPSKIQLLKTSLNNRATVIGALFIFAYQGAEVSISGWVISFLITYRQGDPAKVGYVTAGFWVSSKNTINSTPNHTDFDSTDGNNTRPLPPHAYRPPLRRETLRLLPWSWLHRLPIISLASA
jgi:fucose permease